MPPAAHQHRHDDKSDSRFTTTISTGPLLPMRILQNPGMARAVRDQLEQALYSLPRHDDRARAIALQIEESIEMALEIELTRRKPVAQDPVPLAEHS
ncbi:hypothetical protein [Devosia ginsengisoli]|uniref:hypothetical protein n=1 Tax=Devosia ginsengisoli TaxID=400770 RepID=UPI0026EBA911|nr:hypothetical protein [Devosia ginsengisoli]MCR6670125.1 hypothetical protein [Devosia ginsengisoli]